MFRVFDVNIALAFLDGAEGKYLDFLGDMLGISRLGVEPAGATSSERNIRFFVEVGTFGDINDSAAMNLPAGALISTSPAGTGIVYQLPSAVILSPSISEVFVATEATRSGLDSNVGRRQLIHHNFLDYTDSLNDTLKVTNDSEIITGRDVESDTNYRFRISNQVLSSETANITAVRVSALSVPGVADIILLPFFRGIGTFDMLIKSTTPTVSDGLLSTITESVSSVTAQGIVPNIRAPMETGMSITGTLTLRRRLAPAEESNITQSVTDNVTDYINNLDIAEDWIENEAVERVMATSDEIKNIGVAGKPFDNKFIFKSSKLEDNKVRSTLVGDYDPDEDERIIVETSFAGATPILFRVAS